MQSLRCCIYSTGYNVLCHIDSLEPGVHQVINKKFSHMCFEPLESFGLEGRRLKFITSKGWWNSVAEQRVDEVWENNPKGSVKNESLLEGWSNYIFDKLLWISTTNRWVLWTKIWSFLLP